MTVSNTSATPAPAPTGTVTVTADGGSCTATLGGSGGSASGGCTIGFVPDGTWTVTATYSGDANYAPGTPVTTSVTVGGGPGPGPGPGVHAPIFTADSPPGFAISGQSYSYTFQAVGTPPIRYSLSGPFWLHINPFTGTVSGTVPNFGGSFGYTVTATNNIGSTSRSFTVFVRQPIRQHHNHANVSTSLSCTSKVHQGQRGNCTLWVTDNGNGAASDVTAQIALPKQLRADYCGFLNFGCSIFNNTASENLGTIYPGQTKSLTVTFTARTRSFLWGNQNPFAFTVKVVGSASSNGGFFGRGTSYSTAYVTIIPFF